MESGTDRIELMMPFRAEYVSIVRLTASGIASRIGFDIETIEDIKVAIAEVCNKFVSIGSNTADNYKIIFEISTNNLNVVFNCDDKSLKCIFKGEDQELGLSIINALMDHVKTCPFDSFLLSMSKTLEGER